MNRRVILIVLDSVGIGDAPDAGNFGTAGSNTLANVSTTVSGLDLPSMERLGLGHVFPILGVEAHPSPTGGYGALSEVSNAMDTTIGHWEMMGIRMDSSFPTYPDGFPRDDVIEPFEREVGREVLGNRAASGTVIMEELGEEHIDTGRPIVYTSADSVFQIAAHEDVIPVRELYRICKIARNILTGDHAVGRVIARPFVGDPGEFERTHRRKDFSLDPPEQTVLDDLDEEGVPVWAVGKIGDIFSRRGIRESHKTRHNEHGIQVTLDLMDRLKEGLIFTNLVDFDSEYGHRNDPAGYARALEEWDRGLERILDSLREGDLLMVSADHGTDPTTPGTDHSRELVPFLTRSPSFPGGVNLGVQIGFDTIGQTILDYFGLPTRLEAASLLPFLEESSPEATA